MHGAFRCTRCGDCCRNLGTEQTVLVLPSDLRRLARFLGLDPVQTEARYLERNAFFSDALERPVRSLRAVDGRCIFLAADNRCTVHPAKPRQCRDGPDAFMTASMTGYHCMQDRPLADTRAGDRDFFTALLTEED